MLSDPQLVAQLIRDVARTEVLPRFRNLAGHEISKKNAGDIVTIADEKSEDALAAGLRRILPNAAVVGEEAASADRSVLDALDDDGPVWIIDPVDGTQNFANGKTCFAMIVALNIGRETRFGWIYEPVADRLVSASWGEGTWEAGQRLAIEPPTSIGAYRGSVNKRIRERLADRYGRGETHIPAEMLRYRCVGAEYADLARGTLHFASYGGHLKPWDHAAGALIHREAGGFNATMETEAPFQSEPELRKQTFLMAPDRDSWYQLRALLGS